MHKVVTCTAPVNIAVVKYWGKRDEKLILPIHDSVSITLSSKHMHAKTSVSMSPDFERDRLWLNGVEESVEANQRLLNCLAQVRARAAKQQKQDANKVTDWKVHVNSENNFPTAAGLASSAAGYACLVYALCQMYGVTGDISGLARQGSGSACRSVDGGFVRWRMGVKDDGSDSVAEVVSPSTHWPTMRCLILVAADTRKKVPSSIGMKRSIETSPFIRMRADSIVPERTEKMIAAIHKKDFNSFAEMTMRDSNSFHAVCQDTFPPCNYMNQVSHAVVELVHKINDYLSSSSSMSGSGQGGDAGYRVAYTFDAGPNACLFLEESDVPAVLGIVKHYFPPSPTQQLEGYVRGEKDASLQVTQEMKDKISLAPMPAGSLRYIISTGIGEGPEVVKDGHLLDPSTGMPITK